MKEKLVYNKILPFGHYLAMAIYPFIFIRKDNWEKVQDIIKPKMLNHERIHFEQQKELWFIGFYLMYAYWWLRYGYKKIPFEKEAYNNQYNFNYIKLRPKFAYKNYI